MARIFDGLLKSFIKYLESGTLNGPFRDENGCSRAEPDGYRSGFLSNWVGDEMVGDQTSRLSVLSSTGEDRQLIF